MGPLALLGLLGAAALAGVSAVPVEKDHIEEMVTRCIVEVLSNALSKPNAPPINPECKEILKKSGRNDRERSENKQLEVRHLKDPAEIEKHHTGSVEKEQSQAEEESKKYMKGSNEEKLAHEEGKSKEEEEGHHTPIQEERLHTEEKKHYQEVRREEEKSYHSEEESKESKRHDKEVERAVLDKKSRSGGTSTEEFPDGNDQRPVGHWHSEEGMQSPYKRIHEGEEGEAEEDRSEKYHHESKERDFSHQQEHVESDESEEAEKEKQAYKPRHYHGKHRMGDSSEEKRGRGGEKEELAEESNTEEAHLWDRRNHRQKHLEESEQQREEKSGYHGRHGSEEVEEKRHADQGGEEYRERWQQSEESSEEENKKHRHSEESNEKWHEEGRYHDGSHEVRRHHSEGRTYLEDEGEEELDRYLSGGSKEKEHRGGGRYRLWDSEDKGSQKAYAQERKGQARRHYSTEDSVEQQRYPGNSEEEEEEVEKKHHSSDQMENEEDNMEEGGYAEREEYRSRLPAESEKRTTASYSPYYPLLWWKSRHFEKRDSTGEQLLEGKEEGSPTLNEKSLFPEYNDYDWWEKKQILSALNHRRTEKRNLGKMNRYDTKRQYNKMDQLAELLNYRKKSAEFPELYNSGEDVKKRHVIRNDRGGLSQRPLTEEEEKELENLAAMDLELQKIAEKFNDNRRG
ncbi:secretogranin-1 [Gavia stellata]|uniref:secretogranin-1 n=1 Tax=Gavia stellata TaxID=37040 RepID=UPI00289B24C4|nr:secretogranin-1 [Gavia stellata]